MSTCTLERKKKQTPRYCFPGGQLYRGAFRVLFSSLVPVIYALLNSKKNMTLKYREHPPDYTVSCCEFQREAVNMSRVAA